MVSGLGSSYCALAVGPAVLWAVGPEGYVQERGMPALHPPGSGDVLTALLWDGRLVVGGEDGVFEHEP